MKNLKNKPATRTLIKEVFTQTKAVRMLTDGYWFIVEVLHYNDEESKFKLQSSIGGFRVDAEECYMFETYSL